ncbi:MAG: DNA-directed RNA polymerase subunit beta', partial [Clostridia bacterium]|nr:DNA-directed RNA polymerase subunit beta' [Clostridia bacterium]
YSLETVTDPATGAVLVQAGDLISEDQAKAVGKSGVEQVYVRSILRCKAKRGVCAHCYGADLASSKKVNVGEAVGIIAAQSIGEPGTQLTMRTFHTGGIAGSDITQGLPRVEELLEARRPKKAAIISEATGRIRMTETKNMRTIVVTSDETGEEFAYPIPFGTRIIVEEGEHVQIGQSLTEGNKAPADILKTNGIEAVYDYIIREVQRVYRLQAVEINDKHIEIIARQMTRKIKIDEPGDTSMLVGTTVDVPEFVEENEKIQARIDAGESELRLAEGSPMLLGITKAALMTESFLSAASFQETTKVLTEAAIRGKVDHLQGLKENVIIGKLIPAGTGLARYNEIDVVPANTDTIIGAEAADDSETVAQ